MELRVTINVPVNGLPAETARRLLIDAAETVGREFYGGFVSFGFSEPLVLEGKQIGRIAVRRG